MHSLLLALIGLLHTVLAVAVWRSKPDRRVNRLFALQTLTFAGWTFGNALLQMHAWLSLGNMLAFASASLIPSSMLMFILHYPDSKAGKRAIWQQVTFCVGGVFALASLATDWMVYDVQLDGGRLSRQAGVLYPFFTAYFIAVFAAGTGVFVQKWFYAKERDRAQLNYYGLGLIISALGGITSNLIIPATTGSSSFSHLGPYFGLLFIASTAHTIIRHRFMDLRIVVHRGLVFTLAVLLSSLPALVLLLLLDRPMLMHRTLPEALLAAATFLAVAVLIPLTRDVVERLLDRYLYRTRVNTRHLLRQASAELTRALELPRALDVIADTIRVAVKPEGVATYLMHQGSLRLASTCAPEIGGIFSASLEPPPVITDALSDREPLVRDELDEQSDLVLCEALSASTWALVLPLFTDDQLVGCIAIGSKRSGDPYFSDDIDALTTLANHASTAVKNAALYGEVVLANEYLTNIVGAMQNGVVAVDSSRVVTLINSTAREMLGLPDETLLKADDLPASFRVVLEEILDGVRETAACEVSLSVPLSSQRLLLFCTATRLYGQGQECVGGVVVFNDLTPLKELDQQRARAESLASVQRLTQTLAHEIGNPLVPIKTLTKLLPERVGDRGFADNLSRIVSREIERIERLVARLQRVAPSENVRHTRIDLRVPLRHAVELVEAEAAQQSTRLEIAVPPDPVPVMGDSAELEELFLNLLTNALEAVIDQPAPSRSVHISVTIDDGIVTSNVRDSGSGIVPDLAHRIFEPFVTTKSRGSGLGLAICNGIAGRHDGRLLVCNAANGGAVFTLALPLLGDSPGTHISRQPGGGA